MPDRRTAIRQMFCISAGVLILPSCMEDKSKSSVLLKNLSIDAEQEKLLEELMDTILPSTDSPGSKDIYAHLFALKMLDDCYTKENQQKFVKGLDEFMRESRVALNKPFVKAIHSERASFIRNFDSLKDLKENAAFFYSTSKKLAIQAYTTSEYFLTKVHVYEMIPSRYHGCVPVKALSSKPA